MRVSFQIRFLSCLPPDPVHDPVYDTVRRVLGVPRPGQNFGIKTHAPVALYDAWLSTLSSSFVSVTPDAQDAETDGGWNDVEVRVRIDGQSDRIVWIADEYDRSSPLAFELRRVSFAPEM